MTGPEIEGIIAASARANVRVFDHAGIRLEFGEASRKEAVTPPESAKPTRTTEATLSDKEHDRQNQDALIIGELRLKQEQLDLMQIENPVLYEQLMLMGELEPIQGEDESDDG